MKKIKSRGLLRYYHGGLPHIKPSGQQYTNLRADCRAVNCGTETAVTLIQSHDYCLELWHPAKLINNNNNTIA